MPGTHGCGSHVKNGSYLLFEKNSVFTRDAAIPPGNVCFKWSVSTNMYFPNKGLWDHCDAAQLFTVYLQIWSFQTV